MYIEANGLRFHVRDEGDGEPVLLLHGFPDSGGLWRRQVPALTAAGFRAIAPDLRGFGESDRPEGVDSYAMPLLVGDVLGMLDALGIERATVVGHDWGAAVGWALAAVMPARVTRLVALTVGHPSGFFADPMGQRERSWYMLFSQHTGVAEEALRRDDWRLFRQLGRCEGDLDAYLSDLGRPGALTAALNWYRANVTAEAFGAANLTPLPPSHVPCWESGQRETTSWERHRCWPPRSTARVDGATRGSSIRATGSRSNHRSYSTGCCSGSSGRAAPAEHADVALEGGRTTCLPHGG
jgi:pimeloyl-ACP methyl ester carboxylesterase